MAKDRSISGLEAVHKIQLHFLDGIRDEKQLISSGSLISQSGYEDFVTERSISNICSYPLCRNPLPSEPRRRGRYRSSLKEHRVYDLQETNRFCSADCLINSRAFAGSLQEEFVPFWIMQNLMWFWVCLMMWIWPTRVWRRTLIYRFSNLRIKENEEIKAGGSIFGGSFQCYWRLCSTNRIGF